MSKEAIKLAIEWIESQPEETTASKYDVNSRYVVLKELEAALTQEQGEPVPFNQQVLDEWTAAFKKEVDYWKARHDILLNSLKKSGVEPVGEMQLSAIIEGVVPVVPIELQLPAGTKLYTTPQQRTWVGLTEEEKIKLWDRAEKRGAYQGVPSFIALIQEVESKLKDKNL